MINRVIEAIHKAGRKVYTVGGAIRDWIMGAERTDYDLVADLTMEKYKRLFGSSKTYCTRIFRTGL